MDNLSHAVVGLAVGEFIHRCLPQESDNARSKTRHRLLLIAGMLASNFPDLDLILTPLLPAPLGYLLHHRGHTHTLLYAIPQALLLAGLLWLVWPNARRLLQASTQARRGLAWALGAGFVLHIMMDSLNSYGIHPFHPFDSRWLFGDMVFIVEPLFWIAFGVPVVMTVRRMPIKILLLVTLFGALLFFMMRGFLGWPSFGLLLLVAAGLAVLQQRAGPRGVGALVAAASVIVTFVGVQAVASAKAARIVVDASLTKEPASRMLDAVMTPFPAHPLCWTFVAITSNDNERRFTLRRGIVSIAPDIASVADCPRGLTNIDGSESSARAIAFAYEVSGDADALRELARRNCHFAAWMRFARAPVINPAEAFDIRFATNPTENFTTLRFADFAQRECPSGVPQWGFPRADLLASPEVQRATPEE